MAKTGNLPRVDMSRFSMVPRADIQRSTFTTDHTLKTTFQTGYLIPIECEEVLPGDVHKGSVTIFARLANLYFPLMDNVTLETFFFFTPNRLVWPNFKKMMGERANPADSISYTVPQITFGDSHDACRLADYLGLVVSGQITAGQSISVNAMPFRMYNLIYNEWFRDQNLQNALVVDVDDGPDDNNDYALKRRNKKHDYFTSALPWPLKGGVEIGIPLAGTAPVTGIAISTAADPTDGAPHGGAADQTGGTAVTGWLASYTDTAHELHLRAAGTAAGSNLEIYADLSQATGATINALRLAFQTQRLLERDARSGTRYTEILHAHFGVNPEDSRLQRPEYIGGGRTNFQTQAIPQTSATGLTGGTTPVGSLSGQSTASDKHRFTCYAQEHGFIIGLVHVTADITYQQGIRRQWTRQSRYDYYWPVFSNLGEQSIRNDEIYATGTDATDIGIFGYQERWAEYRHRPSMITGLFRSTSTGTIDQWHLSQEYTALPTLNETFMADTPPFARVLAAGSAADNVQVLFDSVFEYRTTRPMPMFSVPGMMDHF